jgi:zinc protease
MAIMADVAQHPAFKAEELDRVRTETLDGLSVSFQRPGGLTGFATPTILYAGSAYGHVAGGTPGSLPKIKRRTWPRPTRPTGVPTTPSWC